ncbi:hypothetical protein VULLAG_LOCUS14173 [Vulpes lagopus]
MQGARRGTRSRVSRITPWAEGSAEVLRPPGCPGPPPLRHHLHMAGVQSNPIHSVLFSKYLINVGCGPPTTIGANNSE